MEMKNLYSNIAVCPKCSAVTQFLKYTEKNIYEKSNSDPDSFLCPECNFEIKEYAFSEEMSDLLKEISNLMKVKYSDKDVNIYISQYVQDFPKKVLCDESEEQYMLWMLYDYDNELSIIEEDVEHLLESLNYKIVDQDYGLFFVFKKINI